MNPSLEGLVRPMVADALQIIESQNFSGVAAARREVARQRGVRDRVLWGRMLTGLRRVLAGLRRVDFALEGTAFHRGRSRARVLVADWMADDLDGDEVRSLQSNVNWDRVFGWRERLAGIEDPAKRFAVEHSLPDWAAQALLDAFGERAAAVAVAIEEPPQRTLRVNTGKTDVQAMVERMRQEGIAVQRCLWAPAGVELPHHADVFHLEEFREGWFEAQDQASQLCGEAVMPPPGGRVLDACAGAGGKTLALAAMLDGKGRILAADVSERKIESLRKRARKAAAHQVRAVVTEEESWSDEVDAFARKADRILLDAPCSGIGSFRRKPEMKWRLNAEDLPRLEAIQRKLLLRAAKVLKPGARLIYSTCTVRREENEQPVEELLRQETSLERVALRELWGKERTMPLSDPEGVCLKLDPHRHGTDGFYTAILRRQAKP